MKVCPNCHLTYDDSASNCGQCGTPLVTVQTQQNPYTDVVDHTAEFDPRDISDNKVLAMIPYLMGWLGIIITLLASGTSPYAAFHVRQALKIQIVTAISLLFVIIPILGWIVIGVWAVIAVVLEIICFIRVCQGKAIEPPIVSGFKFLK